MTTPNLAGIVSRPSAYTIDPARVWVDPEWNVRFDMGDIAELARQIVVRLKQDPKTGGLINDMRVQRLPAGDERGDFKLIDGQRRMTAINLLRTVGVDGSGPVEFPFGVPAKVEHQNAKDLDLMFAMYLANEGKEFLPVEEAQFFKRLRGLGLTIEDIEAKVKKSDNYIVGSLALLDAVPELVEAVKSGEIKAGLAKSIAVNARGDAVKQAEIVADVKAAGKDKVKRRAVLKKIDDARRAKADKKGLKLKMRALDKDDLSKLGERVARLLAAKTKQAGWDEQVADSADVEERIARMVDFVTMDESLAAAYTLGALQGLKAAAGLKVTLDV